MSEQHIHPEPPDELERLLGALKPRPSRLNRDRLMFEAGRAAQSARGRRLLTAATASIAASLLACLAMAWSVGSQPRVVERVVFVYTAPEPLAAPPPTAAEPPAADRVTPRPSRTAMPRPNYLQLRDTALVRGVDALPGLALSSAVASGPPLRRASLDALLERESSSSGPVNGPDSIQPLNGERL